MQMTLVYTLLIALQGGVLGAGNPCAPGTKIADECYDIGAEGCCSNQSSVVWCEGDVLCELSCKTKPACGWKASLGAYDCGTVPKPDSACDHPYSCFADGCAPAYEQKGCCECSCKDCVCKKDPYCCNVSWDPVCVNLCTECGGCGSPDGCTAAPTPGCVGCDLDVVGCVCGHDPFCCTGKWDSLCALKAATDCNAGCEVCQPDCAGNECGDNGCLGLCGVCEGNENCENGKCVKQCKPSCVNKDCGSDGCDGNCGKCKDGFYCNDFQKCAAEPCEASCEDDEGIPIECGDDGCGGSCGKCEENVACVKGVCTPGACVPDCKGKECGEDGCGWFCGFCPAGNLCQDNGKCQIVCKPNCLAKDKECGASDCPGISCGECAMGLSCSPEGKCQVPCFPTCNNSDGTVKQCGSDGCCGSCGECPPNAPFCMASLGFSCSPQCTPNCMGKECGTDGCGGACGQCPANWFCQQGMCVPQCQPQCLVPPAFMAYKQCGWDECPAPDGSCMGTGTCGVCPEGFYCGPGYICVEDKCDCGGKACGIPNVGCPACGVCEDGFSCDEVTFKCVPCQPDCTIEGGGMKQCGDDGCGGSCGQCQAGMVCDEDPNDGNEFLWVCVPCEPKCQNTDGSMKQCGSDGCSGQCGQCPPGWDCEETELTGDTVCIPCAGSCINPIDGFSQMQCGPKDCPAGCLELGLSPCNTMADCAAGQLCNIVTHMCVACESCGECMPGWNCDLSTEDDAQVYVCDICTPKCKNEDDGTDRECGKNGCGGTCGMCPQNWICNEEDGQCEEDCSGQAALCFGKECGPADCTAGCLENATEACGPGGTCPEGLECDPNTKMCVDCDLNCGSCGDGWVCSPGNICLEDECSGVCSADSCGTVSGCECGECEEGFDCVANKCESSTQPEIVEQDEPDIQETVSPPDIKEKDENNNNLCPPGFIYDPEKGACKCPEGMTISGQTCVCKSSYTEFDLGDGKIVCCPPGSSYYYGKCREDEDEGGGGDEGCDGGAAQRSHRANLIPTLLLLGLSGLAAVLMRRRRRFD